MARQIFVLALVLIALFGLVSFAASAPAPAVPNDDAIGTTEDAKTPVSSAAIGAVAGPLGSELAAKNIAPAVSSGDATAVLLSDVGTAAVTGVAAIASFFIF